MRNWGRFPNERSQCGQAAASEAAEQPRMTHAARRIAMACHHSWRWCQTIESSTGAEPCSGSACQSYPSMKAHAQRDVRAHVQLQVRQLAQPESIHTNPSQLEQQRQQPARSLVVAAATTSLTRRCCKMPHTIQVSVRAQAARALSAPTEDSNASHVQRHSLSLSMVVAAATSSDGSRAATSPPAAGQSYLRFHKSYLR